MTIPARSVMTTDIVTVSPETTVAETARRMLIHHVSAVPVVDPDTRTLFITDAEMIRRMGVPERIARLAIRCLDDNRLVQGDLFD